MARKAYQWAGGATLEDHSKRKHDILRQYFAQYLSVRCQLPQQEKFRLAVVDGFSGGGRYKCGTAGSPIIFIEELRGATERVNLARTANGMKPLEIECLLILNDFDGDAFNALKGHVAPLQAEIAENVSRLHLRIEFLNLDFEAAFQQRIKPMLAQGRYSNLLFNLDQCGYSLVRYETLMEVMRLSNSVEAFYTFAIDSLLAYLQKSNPSALTAQTRHLGVDLGNHAALNGLLSRNDWLGAAERVVFESFAPCATYVSPFSINNPDGWRYWLIHFANRTRARQVYNNILHDQASSQAHFGRSGLQMLSYDPQHNDASLYLFDLDGRKNAHTLLLDDIPRMISNAGDVMLVGDFYESAYNATPAHADDIHRAIIESPDIEVITPDGGERRKAHTITQTDVLKLKAQKSFFPMFFGTGDGAGKS
jgi:three-Cys-motif partner protein